MYEIIDPLKFDYSLRMFVIKTTEGLVMSAHINKHKVKESRIKSLPTKPTVVQSIRYKPHIRQQHYKPETDVHDIKKHNQKAILEAQSLPEGTKNDYLDRNLISSPEHLQDLIATHSKDFDNHLMAVTITDHLLRTKSDKEIKDTFKHLKDNLDEWVLSDFMDGAYGVMTNPRKFTELIEPILGLVPTEFDYDGINWQAAMMVDWRLRSSVEGTSALARRAAHLLFPELKNVQFYQGYETHYNLLELKETELPEGFLSSLKELHDLTQEYLAESHSLEPLYRGMSFPKSNNKQYIRPTMVSTTSDYELAREYASEHHEFHPIMTKELETRGIHLVPPLSKYVTSIEYAQDNDNHHLILEFDTQRLRKDRRIMWNYSTDAIELYTEHDPDLPLSIDDEMDVTIVFV